MSEINSNKAALDIEKILSELTEDNVGKMTEEDIIKYRKKLNLYGRTIEGSNNYLTFSFTNLTEKYQKKLLLTTMVGFLNRAVDEWHVPDGLPIIPVYDYIQNPELIDNYHKDWKMTPKLQKEVNENKEWMAKRIVVKEFLEEMFQYNPDVHVRSAYRPQPKDIDRKILDTPAARLAISELNIKDPKFKEYMVEFDRVQKLRGMSENNLLSPAVDDLVAKKLILPEYHYSTMDFSTWTDEDKNLLKTASEMIPPEDTFHRYTNYLESNYDKLREAVLYLYCDKPDFDMAINPYSWHSSIEEAQDFQKKHRGEVIADIFIGHSGKWNMFAPFAKVRETAKFFNENTIVLEEIAAQMERDAKLGQDMMKNRKKIKKRENIKEEGPESEYFTKWREQNDALREMGVSKENEPVDECPPDALEVPVWGIAGGKLERTNFYTKAMAPELPTEEKKFI